MFWPDMAGANLFLFFSFFTKIAPGKTLCMFFFADFLAKRLNDYRVDLNLLKTFENLF